MDVMNIKLVLDTLKKIQDFGGKCQTKKSKDPLPFLRDSGFITISKQYCGPIKIKEPYDLVVITQDGLDFLSRNEIYLREQIC